jgi:hypothetical protein
MKTLLFLMLTLLNGCTVTEQATRSTVNKKCLPSILTEPTYELETLSCNRFRISFYSSRDSTSGESTRSDYLNKTVFSVANNVCSKSNTKLERIEVLLKKDSLGHMSLSAEFSCEE